MEAIIWDIRELNFNKVAFYTVQIEGRDHTEYYDFLHRMKGIPEYKQILGHLTHFIHEIGKKYGARPGHFRHERGAEALPPPYFEIPASSPSKYGLRLYCIRVSERIVILLNGDLKTQNLPNLCPNCKRHFELANKLSPAITTTIAEGNLRLEGKRIVSSSGDEDDLIISF